MPARTTARKSTASPTTKKTAAGKTAAKKTGTRQERTVNGQKAAPKAKKTAAKRKTAAKKKPEEMPADEQLEATSDAAESATEVDVFDDSEARAEVRAQLDRDIEAFLASGGKIQQIDRNVMADPPRKPVVKYGSRSI